MKNNFKRLFSEDDLPGVIDMFLEYRDIHGYGEDEAKVAAVNEFIDGYDASIFLYNELQVKRGPLGYEIQKRLEELENWRKFERPNASR